MSADQKTAPDTKPASPFAMLDVERFGTKPAGEPSAATKEIAKAIDEVAEANGFHSREAKPAKPAKPAKRKRFNSSGNKVQLNLKVEEGIRDRFYAMAGKRKIRVLADLLEKAMDALDKADPVK